MLLIDAGQPGAGVSSWTLSWVNASTATSDRSYFNLRVAGMAAYRVLAAEVGADRWWHPTGHLRWVEGPTKIAALLAAVDQLRSWGYDAAVWSATNVRRRLEPKVRFPSEETEVAFFGDEGWIDGRALVTRLVDGAVSLGAETRFGQAVVDISVKGDRITEVVLSDGERSRVDAVVNAAGPAGSDVARLVGRTLSLRDDPGFIARLRCDDVPIRRVMHAPHIELRPDGATGMVLHSREVDALIEPTTRTSELCEELRRRAVGVVPSVVRSELIDARVAWRPMPIDGYPSVGGVDGMAGYYEAVTHSGITLGAVLGRLLAKEVIDGRIDELIAPYRPGRFLRVERASQ